MKAFFILAVFFLSACASKQADPNDIEKKRYEFISQATQDVNNGIFDSEAVKMFEGDTLLGIWGTRQQYMECESQISKCESETDGKALLKCREDLKFCQYNYERLKTDYGKRTLQRISGIHAKCYTYGYERHDYSKLPKNAVIQWTPSVKGHGNFKTLDECIEASKSDKLAPAPHNTCVQRDWCNGTNSLAFKQPSTQEKQ